MKTVLENILPRILPNWVQFHVILHEGKSDLNKSIPIKIQGWRQPNTFFIVLQDQDSHNCIELKNTIKALCVNSGRDDVLIRIVCTELESWFIGDLLAVERAFNKSGLQALERKRKYRAPDNLGNPAQELIKLVENYQKLSGSRQISSYMDLENNNSTSFNYFISGINKLLAKVDSYRASSETAFTAFCCRD